MAHRTAVLNSFAFQEQLAQADPAVLRPVLAAVNNDLLAASEREARAGARIIVWPETGAGILADDKADLITRAGALARHHGVYLGIGLGVLAREAPYVRNQAILIDQQGRVVWTYDKAHPRPWHGGTNPGRRRGPRS